ncbi:MAG: hypothetical protein U0232_16585 [Thermomicrobiales bacterium]
MSIRNLWGEIPTESEIKPPVTILREQATILGERTGNIIQGRVLTEPHFSTTMNFKGSPLQYGLYLLAPALDNYLYKVLEIRHDLQMYPVEVISSVAENIPPCQNEQELLVVLETILSSPKIHRVIAALITQSRAIA